MNRRTMALKKVTGVFVGLLIVSAGINAWKLIPPYLADFSVKSKIVTSIVEVNDQFLGTDILVPEFVPFEKDPYAYVSVPEYTLVRSRQKGDWDGYVISITPTKLSNSHYYQLMISAQTTDQFSDRELTWELRDVSHYYRQTQNVTQVLLPAHFVIHLTYHIVPELPVRLSWCSLHQAHRLYRDPASRRQDTSSWYLS